MEDSDVEVEATPAEKLVIAKHFIMHSPNGEVDAVVKDMRTLIGADLLTKQWETDVRTYYSKKQLIPVGSGDSRVLVSGYSETEPGKYINPNTKTVVSVDPVSLEPSGPEEGKVMDEEGESLRAATQAALDAYVKRNYMDNKGAAVVYAKDGKLDVVISMKNLNLANFWSGGWRSEYSIEVGQPGPASLTGRVRINVHYFEDGNVQLNTDYAPAAPSITISDDATATGKAIAKAIGDLESSFHTKFDDFYVQMHHETFKAMRRILPKTAKKMEWNSGYHAIASEMGDARS